MKKKLKAKKAKLKGKKKGEILDPNIEKVYEKTITFMCPIRGLVTQKVKVKRYKPKEVQSKDFVKTNEDLLSQIDETEEVEELDTSLMDIE